MDLASPSMVHRILHLLTHDNQNFFPSQLGHIHMLHDFGCLVGSVGLTKIRVRIMVQAAKWITVPAPSLSAVNDQKLFFGQWGAVNTQERLVLKDYFFKNNYESGFRPNYMICRFFIVLISNLRTGILYRQGHLVNFNVH